MPSISSAGPFETFSIGRVASSPFYLVPFDKRGRCEGPLTRAHLIDAARSGRFTDIYIFSHGWNNVFKVALERYRSFFTGYLSIRAEHRLDDPATYRPLFVGIVWPSTALVLPWEDGPGFATFATEDAGMEKRDQAMADEDFTLRELASDLPDEALDRFYELAQRGPTLTRPEALELATILLGIYKRPDTELGTDNAVSAEELLGVWKHSGNRSQMNGSGEGGLAPNEGTPAANEPAVAGILDYLDPRNVVRTATVWQMKDRAGTVGANGVCKMLQEILGGSAARVHLIGHSYGAKVVLSALCHLQQPCTVSSVLLLQPAISYLSFGENVDGKGTSGGYREALKRVKRPIFSTFSRHDAELTKLFHLAVRRDSDLGEQKIAGIPPSKFAALGGFGPGGTQAGESRTLAMPDAPEKYQLEGARIVGIDGSDGKITGHGDVSNRFTEWALVNLVSGEALP